MPAPIHLRAPRPNRPGAAAASVRNGRSPNRKPRLIPRSSQRRNKPSGLQCKDASRAIPPRRAVARRNRSRPFRARLRAVPASDKTFHRKQSNAFRRAFRIDREPCAESPRRRVASPAFWQPHSPGRPALFRAPPDSPGPARGVAFHPGRVQRPDVPAPAALLRLFSLLQFVAFGTKQKTPAQR